MIDPKNIDMDKLNATIIDYRDQVQRLRECAERLQYEMDAITTIKAERDKWVAKHKECTQLLGEAMQDRSDMAVERDALKQHLSNLLARIHRDGGHYEAEHGTDLAVEHADVKVAVVYANLSEVWDRIVALEKERHAYAAAADTMAAAHKVERDALRDAARLALDVMDDLSGVGMSEVECLSVLRAIAALMAVL